MLYNDITSTINAVRINPMVRRAVKVLSPNETIVVSRLHKPRRNGRGETLVVTIGKPNYANRMFIAACKKAGEPLPVKKVQLKYWPKKRV